LTDFGCGFAINADGSVLYRYFGNSIFISRNGGQSWSQGSRPKKNSNVIVSIAAHPKQPEVATAKIRTGVDFEVTETEFFITIDKGATWQRQGKISEISGLEDALFYGTSSEDVMYAVGATSNVTRLSDGDDSWASCAAMDVPSPNSATVLAIHPNDTKQVYLATLGKGIQFSNDRCQSWQASSQGLTNLFVNTLAIDPNQPETMYAGTDGGAYVSFDGGATWSQINDGLLGATVVYSIVVDRDSNVYAATPYGIFQLEGK
jgi:photosystem II stability/assembly factor-like uncharacterized protein